MLCSVTGDVHYDDAAFDGPDLDEDGLGCFGFCREMNDSLHFRWLVSRVSSSSRSHASHHDDGQQQR